MKERETVENKKVDQEIITNIENKFDKIQNPDLWLQHGFDTPNNKKNFIYLPNNSNSVFIYEKEEPPVKQLNRINSSKKVIKFQL